MPIKPIPRLRMETRSEKRNLERERVTRNREAAKETPATEAEGFGPRECFSEQESGASGGRWVQGRAFL